jgi:NADPH-dependent glutamate synthase beta subunit-like oxidoreductase
MVEKKDFKAFVEFYEKQKVNIRKHFVKKSHTYSVAIVGAGPAGLETALQIS